MHNSRTSDDDNTPFFELQKAAPSRKGRNLKNLAVNTNRHPGRAASTTSLPLPAQHVDDGPAVMSPAFVKPPTPPKRKPSNLGLTLTISANSNAPSQPIRLAIPPTPSLARPGTLRHFQSSPSLPLFPDFRGPSGEQPPLLQTHTQLETIFSPISPSEPTKLPIREDDEQNFDVPLSREEKPEAYPDGPICVYLPHVDLYLEPTAEQARQYDVILNVASEVRNPFQVSDEPPAPEPQVRLDGGGGIQYAPKRDHLAVVNTISDDATQEASPTTPKATPLSSVFSSDAVSSLPVSRTDASPSTPDKEPEYIHIPWEHNSDIVPDLLRLCKLIDEKVKEDKRVLVHCQCGVSRSASLVVAYGLFKDPAISVQDAYDAVKMKSKWIGPNMNLIMQLQEFRSSLARGGLLSGNRGVTPITPSSALSEWAGPFAQNQNISPVSPLAAVPMSAGVAPTSVSTVGPISAVSPGPSSAPSGLSWPKTEEAKDQRSRALSAVRPGSAYVDTSGHVIPMLKVVEVRSRAVKPEALHIDTTESKEEDKDATPTEPVASPRSAEFAMTPLLPPKDADPADAFGLLSPSSTEYASSPFDRTTLLTQLGMAPVGEEEQPQRSKSVKNRPKPLQEDQADMTKRLPLRGKMSSPTLRERQQLQSLQARIEANLPQRPSLSTHLSGIDEALMSPRATEFTQNPFAMSAAEPATSGDQSPNTSNSDPRSPAQKGQSPIVRNIEDVL